MTSWLELTIKRLLEAVDALEDTITDILTDLDARNAGADAHDRMLGVMTSVLREHSDRLTKVETRLSKMEGRQTAEDLATASTPWWRDWWAVLFMLLTVVPVTLGTMLALGLMTPDQTKDAAKSAVEGLLKVIGLGD